MRNKSHWMVGVIAICLMTMVACKTRQPASMLKKAVMAADSIALFQVDANPTLPSEQRTGEFYLHDYRVIQRQPVSAAQMGEMKTALLDATTFDTSAVKSCPMVAQMALQLQHKGKSTLSFVLSPAPCGKAILFDAEKPRKPVYLELAPGNRLEPLVFGR
jgi:hypothetical protein